MSTAFIGLTVVVKLKSPPITLQGLVGDVQGQRLYLLNVTFLASGKKLKEYTIHGLEIEDIEVVNDDAKAEVVAEEQETDGGDYESKTVEEEVDAPRNLQSPSGIHPTHAAALRPAQVLPSKQFVDPAILSYGRRPSKSSHQIPGSDASYRLTASSIPMTATAQVVPSHTTGHHHDGMHEPHTKTFDYLVFDNETHEVDQAEVVVTADGTSSRNDSVSLETTAASVATATISNALISNIKTRQRANKKKKRQDVPLLPATGDDQLSSPEFAKKQPHSATDSNGWRQTPILQEPFASTTKPASKTCSTPKKTRRQRAMEIEQAQNGWATEDATDVQDLGDFDFESNLANFDKKTVFEQLREADTTADEDRLVSFNRLPARPGTFGGKNLHPSEMVLDITARRGSRDVIVHQDNGNGLGKRSSTGGGHMSDDSDVEVGERNGSMSSSRLLRRDFSRASTRAVQAGGSSRKSSGVVPATAALEQTQQSTSQPQQPHQHPQHYQLLQSAMPSTMVPHGAKPAVHTQVLHGQQQIIPNVQSLSISQPRSASPVASSQKQISNLSGMPILRDSPPQQQQQQQYEHHHQHHHHHHEQHQQDPQDPYEAAASTVSQPPPPSLPPQPQQTRSPTTLPLVLSEETLAQLEGWAKVQMQAGEAILSIVERVRMGSGGA